MSFSYRRKKLCNGQTPTGNGKGIPPGQADCAYPLPVPSARWTSESLGERRKPSPPFAFAGPRPLTPVRQRAGNKTTRKSAFNYPRVYPCKWNKSKGKCQIRTEGTKWKRDD